ncbi:hypothetical protein Tco_1453583 [Tanacetum coccineum]
MMASTLWIKLYSGYEYGIRYHPGKANVVTDALSRKERVKPRRFRAMAMTIQYGVRGMILVAQSEAFKQENVLVYRLRLPEELNSVHDTLHVSNLKKCLADANLHVPLDEIKVDKTLRFVEEPSACES